MRKFILYILAAIIVSSLSLTTGAFANYSGTKIIAANEFKPSFIPKPDTLPGIEPSQQQSKTSRNIFTNTVLPRFAVILIGLTGSAALLFVIIGGVRLVLSYGAEEALESGKKQIIWGLIGFAVSLLAYTIVSIVTNLQFTGDTTKPTTETTQQTPAPSTATPPKNK